MMLVTLADAKHYNEILRALGHAFCEEFVRSGVAQLSAMLPPDLPIYQISVLSFAAVLDHDSSTEPPTVVLDIVRNFATSVRVKDIPIKTRVGVGLVPLNRKTTDPSEVLRASLAAAQDSRCQEEGYAFYNHRTDAAHIRAFRILADLPAALASKDQLSLHFQPRIDLRSSECRGAEALLRWTHPEIGAIPPGEFIPLAEQTALIGPLTDWVLGTALTHTAHFVRGGRHLRVSINASPTNLSEEGFDERLLRLCRTHRLKAENVELEFTEGTLAGNFERATRQLERLRQAGIEVAIDDFGSGFSSLSYLTSLPADILKIDQSFVRPLGAGKNNDFMLRQIVAMANGLGFKTCAEGIETARAYDLVKSLGCDEGQGYFIARPMPAEAFDTWMEAHG
jgi:EAL domain-containing protein (putative c-di-GMP-specific phosphodiesterase class I)